MQCNKNTPHPSPCFCRFKPRELTLHSTASFLLVWTHLLLFVSQSSQLFSRKCILQELESYNHKEDSLSLLEAPSAPHLSPSQLAASCTPTLLLFSSLSFAVTQKQFWKVFWTHQSVELKHMALVLPAYFVPKRERLCMTTRGGWRGSHWGQS